MAFIDTATEVPLAGPFGVLYDTCHAILEAIAGDFTEAGIEPPETRFVSNGQPVYEFLDTEYLIAEPVMVRPGAAGIPSFAPVEDNTVYSLEVAVHLIRTVPVGDDAGNGPAVADVVASAALLLADMWALQRCVIDRTLAGARGAPSLVGVPFRACAIQQIERYGPQGGLGGSIARLIVEPR